MGGEPGDALAALQQGVDRAKRVADDLLNTLKALANAFLGELKDGGFSVIENFVGRLGLLAGLSDSGVRDVDQPAQDGLVADDSNVMLDGGAIGHAVKQSGDVADIADRLQVLLLLQLFDQRNDVDGPRGFGQIHHSRIDAAVGVDRKTFGLDVPRWALERMN